MSVPLSGPLSRKLAAMFPPPRPAKVSTPIATTPAKSVAPETQEATRIVGTPANKWPPVPIGVLVHLELIETPVKSPVVIPPPDEAVDHRPVATVQRVIAECAKVFGVSRIDITSKRRTRTVVRPRQAAMYVSKMLTLRSLPEIGRAIGMRDHTTILYGVRKISELIEIDAILAADVAAVISKFRSWEARR